MVYLDSNRSVRLFPICCNAHASNGTRAYEQGSSLEVVKNTYKQVGDAKTHL